METVRLWGKRFNRHGLDGLHDQPRAGRPPTYPAEVVGEVLAAALTKPTELGLPFGSWTLDRLAAYLQEQRGIGMKRWRIGEILSAEGLRWRTQETWFGERVAPEFAHKKGAIVGLYTAPPAGSVTVCLDQMGPEAATSFRGQQIVRALPSADGSRPAERATQEIDYGRRGKGYVCGAFVPATGEALTAPYPRRTIANWVEFLEQVEQWLPRDADRVYAILDNLSTHHALDGCCSP